LIREDAELTTDLVSRLRPIKVDRSQIDQVIMNLVVNARDAMPEGGTIRIETANEEIGSAHSELQPGHYVRLSVVDTGIGMDAATQTRVFEPFFTTKEHGRGTGLGLATVYGIVKQSGGHISLKSAPGRGTTFHVFLPCVDCPEDQTAAPDLKSVRSKGGETILIVEDEPMVRNLAGRVLRSHGYRVVEACDGEEALRALSTDAEPFRLMITDMVMPRGGGAELANRLREARPDARVIFMSGHTDDAFVHQGVLHSQADFLQKPFSAAALTRKVREVLDR
jgi:CheY-like chemotaxis protein